MIYTDMTKKALKLCFDSHKDQVDKSGMPYVFHPFHVAEQMNDETTTIVALLHDVVEDTNVTLQDIAEMGFDLEVIDALKLLTHDESLSYFDYIKNIANNPVARTVKMADLVHNSDLSRLDQITEKDLLRLKKYQECLEYLRQFNRKENVKSTFKQEKASS